MSESNVDILEDKGRIKLAGLAVSTDEVPLEEMKFLEKRLVNHNVIHKHVTPHENPRSEVVAQIDSAVIKKFIDKKDGKEKDGLFIETDYLLNITPFQRDTIEYVTLKDKINNPIKFSIAKQKFGVKGQLPKYSVPLELTLTTIPYCKSCVASVKKMEDEEEKKLKARIGELESSLKAAIGKADMFEKELEKAKEGKADVDSLEDRIASIRKVYEGQVETITTQMEDMKNEWRKEKEDWAKEKLNLVKAPVLADVLKLERDPWVLKNFIPKASVEELKDRLEFLKTQEESTPLGYVTRMEETRYQAEAEAKKFNESVVSKLEKTDPIMAKLMRGDQLTPEERRSLGV